LTVNCEVHGLRLGETAALLRPWSDVIARLDVDVLGVGLP